MNNYCIIKINKETNESGRRALIQTSALIGCFNGKKKKKKNDGRLLGYITVEQSLQSSCTRICFFFFFFRLSGITVNLHIYILKYCMWKNSIHTPTTIKHTHNHTHTQCKAHAPLLITASIHQCVPPSYAYAEHRIVSDHIKSSGNNR